MIPDDIAAVAAGLGALIRDKRAREGLSLRDASEQSGVAFSTLGRLENGANPSLQVDRKVRAWLGGAEPVLPAPPMTLRDWFASRAPEPPSTWWGNGAKDCAGYAMWNYQYAEAMMQQRAHLERGAS